MKLTQSLAATVLATGFAACMAGTGLVQAEKQDGPLVIGHRGASGYRPEHTLASYELAIQLGADFIEPDLVSTGDGILVARHENEISGTTNIATHSEFADRRTTKVIDGASITGWFTEDFTLAELKTLRAVERLPAVRQENTLYNGLFEVPTFQEVIDLVKRLSKGSRTIGIYPETKHPSYFQSIGLPLEEPLAETLQRNGLSSKNAAVFVQSFEVANLRKLSKLTGARLIQLFGGPSASPFDFVLAGNPKTYGQMATPAGLTEISTYAYGVGPDKNYVIPRDASGNLAQPTSFVADAHAAGLRVHPYTRFGTRTSSCQLTCESEPTRMPTAGRSTSTWPSTARASMGSSATTATRRFWLGDCSSRTDRGQAITETPKPDPSVAGGSIVGDSTLRLTGGTAARATTPN